MEAWRPVADRREKYPFTEFSRISIAAAPGPSAAERGTQPGFAVAAVWTWVGTINKVLPKIAARTP